MWARHRLLGTVSDSRRFIEPLFDVGLAHRVHRLLYGSPLDQTSVPHELGSNVGRRCDDAHEHVRTHKFFEALKQNKIREISHEKRMQPRVGRTLMRTSRVHLAIPILPPSIWMGATEEARNSSRNAS